MMRELWSIVDDDETVRWGPFATPEEVIVRLRCLHQECGADTFSIRLENCTDERAIRELGR